MTRWARVRRCRLQSAPMARMKGWRTAGSDAHDARQPQHHEDHDNQDEIYQDEIYRVPRNDDFALG